MRRARVVEHPGEQVMGEKAAVAPVGSPEVEKETACVVPEVRVALMVLELEAPWATDWLPLLVREKSKAVAVTVKAKLVERVTPPPMAVTVIV